MGYVIFWILVLATALLFLATVTSLTARSEKRLVRQFVPRLVCVLILLMFVLVTVVTGFIYFVNKISPPWPFYFCLTLTLAFFISGYWAMQRGISKSRPGPPAVSWPRALLAGSFGIVLFLCLLAFFQLAQDRRNELLTLRANDLGIAMKVWPPRLPDKLNAALFYDQASQALTGQDFIYNPNRGPQMQKDRPKWLSYDYPLMPDFDPASEAAHKIIEDHRHVIGLIDKGVTCPGFYTEFDADNFAGTSNFYTYSIRELACLKKLEAITKAQKGDISGAMADLAMIERISDQLTEIPTLLSVIASARVSREGYNGLEYILAHYQGNTAGALPLYSAGLKQVNTRLRRAFEFENAIWQDSLFLFMTKGRQNVGLSWGPENWTDIYLVFYLPAESETMEMLAHTYLKAVEQPYPEASKTLAEAYRKFVEEPQGMLFRIYGHFFRLYHDRAVEFEAHRRLASLAIAAFNYKQDNGKYPETLEELVPKYIDAVPIDPFDLKPLKMKALDDSLDLYSIGIDPQSKLTPQAEGPIHFYLGANAYQEYRVKPFQEQLAKKRSTGKKKK